MNNPKILLGKAITLLYRESQQKSGNDSKVFIRDVLNELKIVDNNMAMDSQNKILVALKELVIEMMRRFDEEPMDYTSILQSARMACGEDTPLYESIRDSIALPLDEESLHLTVVNLRRELKSYLSNQRIKETLSRASAKLLYNGQEIPDVNKYVREVISTLDSYATPAADEKDPAIIAEVNMTNKEEMVSIFQEIKKVESGDAIIRTPWQGLNRMIRGGFRRDQLAVISALTHHGKSYVAAGTLVGAALYNDPYKILNDKTKKPALCLISSEDDMNKILSQIYTFLRENIDGVKVDAEHLASIDPLTASEYMVEKLGSRGYEFLTLRVNPSMWTLHDIKAYIMKLEAKGYEIQYMVVDYLNMFSKEGVLGDTDVYKIQNLFQQFRNFVVHRRIATLTPHQMSGDATELLRSGKKDIVKMVAGKNYYDGCKGVGREVDLEICVCKVNDNGSDYLTFARGKHRVTGATPTRDLYTVYKFSEIGGIRFDVDEQDQSLSKIGAYRDGNGEEQIPSYDDF